MKKTTAKAKTKPAAKVVSVAPAKTAAKTPKVLASNYDPMHNLLRGVHAHKVIR